VETEFPKCVGRTVSPGENLAPGKGLPFIVKGDVDGIVGDAWTQWFTKQGGLYMEQRCVDTAQYGEQKQAGPGGH
jgi:hypothetical protein